MGKTLRNFNGEEHREKSKKKYKNKKWFGFTDGNHSDEHYIADSMSFDEDGNLTRDYETRPAIKGKDYIKYGYPNGAAYPKHIYKAKKKGYDEPDDDFS